MSGKSPNRRWVAVMLPRSGPPEVYGLFNKRVLAYDEMTKRIRLSPHRYIAGKVTQVRQSIDPTPDKPRRQP